MNLLLRVLGGGQAGKVVALARGQHAVIGRSDRADFRIPGDMRMSGRHFEVVSTPDGFRLVDAGSTNGTKVNDEPARAVLLKDGDRIVAGETEFLVRLDLPIPDGGELLPRSIPVRSRAEEDAGRTMVPPPTRRSRPGPIWKASRDDFRSALRPRGEPAIFAAALEAALWTRQEWLVDFARRFAGHPPPEGPLAARMLALLGGAGDLETLLVASRGAPLDGISWLGTFGHPRGVDAILDTMARAPELALAAGRAFTKITGMEVPKRVDGSDAPDVPAARRAWRDLLPAFAGSTRWCRGHDVSGPVPAAVLEELDLESRWEIHARLYFQGTRPARKRDWERFPWSAPDREGDDID